MSMRWVSISTAVLITCAVAGQEPRDQAPAKLAGESRCFECHSVDKKVVGPAYRDVAARYKKDPKAREWLIEKVKKGGKGNWTVMSRDVPMPPYSPRLTDDEISLLVDWILSLDSGRK